MGQASAAVAPGRVERVRGRIKEWRKTRSGGAPMPEGLWAESVELARELGVGPAARALGVDYGALKRRASEAGKQEPGEGGGPSGGFVELPVGAALGTTAMRRTEVELSRADGAKLVIRLPGDSAAFLLGLATAFWGRGT